MSDDNLIPPIQQGGQQGSQRAAAGGEDYRQLQEPIQGIEPWRLPNSGGAERAEALGNAFKEFSGAAGSLSDKLATSAGKAAGAQAGAAGKGAALSGLAAITPFGQAYDAAAHATYATQSQLGLEQQLTDIERKSLGDPDAFAQQAGAATQAAIKEMPGIYQPEMTLWAQARIQAGTNRQALQKQTDVQNQALATYQSSSPDLITSALHTAAALPGPQGDAVIQQLHQGDLDRLNALVASRTITPEQANTLHQKFLSDADNQFSGQKIDTSLQPIIASMRSNVIASDKLILQADPNLTPEENQARQAEYEKDRAAWTQTQSRARVDDLNNVHQALGAGSYGASVEGQVRSLYKVGAMTEEGYFSAMSESLRNQRGALEDDASLKLVDAAVHGEGPPLDPKDPAARKAVDLYFQTHVAMSGNVSDPQYAIGASTLVKQLGILPRTVQAQIRVGLLSGDPTTTARAAALAAKIQRDNPDADVYSGNKRIEAIAGLVNDNTSAGLPPAQAMAMAHQAVDISPEQKKVRDAGYAAGVKASNRTNNDALQSVLQSQDGSLFTHAPQAPVGMQAAYDSLTRQYFSQVGDIAKAREIAGNQLRQSWRVTSVNGSPEYQQYGVPDSQVPTVRADIASSVKAAGYQGDPSAVHLTPNENTVSSQGRSWTLTHTDPQTGAQDVLLGSNNRPLRYDLPSGQDFAKAQQDLAAQKIDAARKQRDVNRATSADQDRIEQELSAHYLNPKSAMSTWGR
jgi:hypothetical protein